MIEELKKYYTGFFIEDSVGNNAFSFDQRSQQKIYVPPVIEGALDDLSAGEEVVFSEYHENQEWNKVGLKQFVFMNWQGKPTFIFDNHNHAFFFWMVALKVGCLRRGSHLIHVDQHKDMRDPGVSFDCSTDNFELADAFQFSQHSLNVGNFIQPAMSAGVFSELSIIDHQEAFEQSWKKPYILDVDIDIFAPEMEYIDQDYKIDRIQCLLREADLITIATSPYFIDQHEAIKWIRRLLTEGV